MNRVLSEATAPAHLEAHLRDRSAGPDTLPPARPRRRRQRGRTASWLALAALVSITLTGFPYYVAPMAERVRSPLHAWFKPSGYVGQSAGILAFLLFVFLWLYPLRKRYARLARFGSIARWLDAHIVAGVGVIVLGSIHGAWRFHGVIGFGYLGMVVVAFSGIAGRYLYLHIPRHRNGVELTLTEVEEECTSLVLAIAESTGMATKAVERTLYPAEDRTPRGVPASILRMMTDDWARYRAVVELERELRARAAAGAPLDETVLRRALRLARRRMALAQQRSMLEATQRIFRHWHVFHLPVAITSFGAVLLHVVVVISLRTTWFW